MAYSKLSEAMWKTAQKWQTRLTQKAYELAISNPDPETGDGRTPKSLRRIIRITTKRDRNSAQRFGLTLIATGPAARAYEYGSGIWSESFEKADYIIIRPKNRKVLAFFWETQNQLKQEYIDSLPHSKTTGKVLLQFVQHPGVKAANNGQGYIRPAIDAVREEGEIELRPSFKKAILEDIQFAFKQGRRR